jgi:LysM repeat protein
VYADNKQKPLKATVKNDTLLVAKEVKKDSVLLMPNKKKQVAQENEPVEEKETKIANTTPVKSDPIEKKQVSEKKTKTEKKPTEVKVKKGETYYSLAKKYNIKIKDLLKYNKLTEKDLLKEGDKIKIPKR